MSTPFSETSSSCKPNGNNNQQLSFTFGDIVNGVSDGPNNFQFDDGGQFGSFDLPSGAATLANQQHQHSSLMNNRDLLFMNRKLSQLALDSNGNDGGGHLMNFSQPVQPENDYLAFNSNHYPSVSGNCSSTTPPPHLWNFDFVTHTLRHKLSALKTAQDDFQRHFLQTQNQYSVFAHAVRQQLNTLLQEMNDDLEASFKCRLVELSSQQQAIEQVLYRIEAKAKASELRNGGSGKNGDEATSSFINYFDAEFVKFVRAIIESTTTSPTVGSSGAIRVPSIEPTAIDRNLRSFILTMLKGGQSTRDGSGNGNVPVNGHHQFGSPSHPSGAPPSGGWGSDSGPNGTHKGVHIHASAQPPTYSAITEQGGAAITRVSNGNQDQSQYHHDPPHQFYQNSTSSNSANSLCQQQLSTTSSSNFDSQRSTALTAAAATKSLQPKLRRDRMSYLLKFGEQGSQYGQFAEPSGVAVSPANEDIYIADANNHRIQVFDRWGKFKFHFGEGKLKFPNRVAISALTGEIVVSERPPVHQIQVYDKTGIFQTKFGSKHLRHPRGLCVDHQNRVVVVECKVMRVFIFNLRGDLLHSFDCSAQIQFPNAVAVSKKEEIYISDNRSHCVKVFNFAGDVLRQIGGQGVTNYPIGLILNEASSTLIVVDNYNNLNVTIFRLDGTLLAAYESSVKHQQCLDVAPLFSSEHTLVVTSKDLQVYIYRIKEPSERPNGTPIAMMISGTTPTRRSFGSTTSSSGSQALPGGQQSFGNYSSSHQHYSSQHSLPSSTAITNLHYSNTNTNKLPNNINNQNHF